MDKLSLAHGKIEQKKRELITAEEREDYLSLMTNLHKKYSSMEQKLTKITKKQWNAQVEIGQIERHIQRYFDRSNKKNKMKKKVSFDQYTNQDASEILLNRKRPSPQEIFQSVEEIRIQ